MLETDAFKRIWLHGERDRLKLELNQMELERTRLKIQMIKSSKELALIMEKLGYRS